MDRNPFFPNRAQRLLARLEPEPVAEPQRRPTAVLPEGMRLTPFPSHAMIAAENRARVSADLTGPGLTICLCLAAAAICGVAVMSFFHQLALLDAALACAARV